MQDDQVNSVLLQALALDSADFVSQAGLIHQILSGWLAIQAQHIIHALLGQIVGHEDSPVLKAALATFHRLASLEAGSSVPISIFSLHDFLIVCSPASRSVKARAYKIVSALLRRKPSLARAIEQQILPVWLAAWDAQPSQSTGALPFEHAKLVMQSIDALAPLQATQDILFGNTTFWLAFQKHYDLTLPQHFAQSGGQSNLMQNPHIEEYIHLRQAYRDFFIKTGLQSLGIEQFLELLEAEASSEPIEALQAYPLTSLINLSLLQDAEYVEEISSSSNLAKTASSEERQYLANSLRSVLPDVDDVQDGLALTNSGEAQERFKAKGKERADGQGSHAAENGSVPTEGNDGDLSLISQVQAILPDAAPETIQSFLASPSIASLPASDKIERIVGALLEGQTAPPLDEASATEIANGLSSHSQPSSAPAAATSAAPSQSRFAAVRSNIFSDAIDVSRIHRGRPSLEDDDFLPSALKASIMAAAQRQDEEAREEEEAEAEEQRQRQMGRREAAFVEDFDGGENDAGQGTVKVKDNIDEESDAEAEEDRMQSSSGATSGQPAASAASLSSGLPEASSSGPDAATEAHFLSLYVQSPATFARSSRRSKGRNELKSKTGLSDEQIEGWARMLERNPRKDKILERAGEFRGNAKPDSSDEVGKGKQRGGAGQSQRQPSVQAGKAKIGPESKAAPGADTQSKTQGQKEGKDGASAEGGSGRGGRGGRGRGANKSGRGHQSDARRRGHDKKMAKTVGVA